MEFFVATQTGCLSFDQDGKCKPELPGRSALPVARGPENSVFAIVDGTEIWQRSKAAEWSKIATADTRLLSLTTVNGNIYAGAMADAALYINLNSKMKRLTGFDTTSGRGEWFAEGPPLHIRSITATHDGRAILAAVHVGGIPRSIDGGTTWKPTIPVKHDAHEVRAHASLPFVAAATAFGLYVSDNAGEGWRVVKLSPDETKWPELLAVAILDDEVLFSAQEGGYFAKQSQIWRFNIKTHQLEQVRQGLPEWLEGKVDTTCIATNGQQTAILDGGGNIWVAKEGSRNWDRIAVQLKGAFGLIVS